METKETKLSIKGFVYDSNTPYLSVYIDEGTIEVGKILNDYLGNEFTIKKIYQNWHIKYSATQGDYVFIALQGKKISSLTKGTVLQEVKTGKTTNRKTLNSQLNETRNKVSLIDSSFLEKGIDTNLSNTFPVMVCATMSSGKSTLINSFLGDEVLPNANQSCTSKRISILDDDCTPENKLYISYKNGKTIEVKDKIQDNLLQANNDNDVKSLLLVGQIESVLNTQKAVLLIDTPGPNDAMNTENEHITYDTLKKLSGGLVIYVINATSPIINDDKRVLIELAQYTKKYPQIKTLYVINKVDELDIEKESVFKLVEDTQKYLMNLGIENPDIIPVSALAALLFRKVLKKKRLSRHENNKFKELYDLFRTRDCKMSLYMSTGDCISFDDAREVDGSKYYVSELIAAVENTGITHVEKYIQNRLIESDDRVEFKVSIS